MASKQFEARTLILVFENGVNAKGDPILVRKSINTLTETASEDDIYMIADLLKVLYELPLNRVSIDEDFTLEA